MKELEKSVNNNLCVQRWVYIPVQRQVMRPLLITAYLLLNFFLNERHHSVRLTILFTFFYVVKGFPSRFDPIIRLSGPNIAFSSLSIVLSMFLLVDVWPEILIHVHVSK